MLTSTARGERSTLESMAPNIGAIIGNTAGDALAARASAIQLNINANVTGNKPADTGGNKLTE